jgi:hypothetical protein
VGDEASIAGICLAIYPPALSKANQSAEGGMQPFFHFLTAQNSHLGFSFKAPIKSERKREMGKCS